MSTDAKKTILVVDDEQEIRDMLTEGLELQGYRVLGAVNAIEASRVLKAETVDLVVLDIMMSWLDGLEFLKILKEDPLVKAPVMVITCRADEKVEAQARELGADAYMVKPFKMQEFFDNVNMLTE